MSDRARVIGAATPGRRPSVLERAARRLGLPLGGGPLRAGAARLLEGALALGTAARGLKCRLPEGETVRVLPKYRSTSWNLDEYRAFRAVLRPGATALDVGANIGGYAMLFGQWVRPHGRVYAFEPEPEFHTALERHVALNDLAGIVVPVAAAASDATGRAGFVTAGAHGISRLSATDEVTSLVVNTITIDEFCDRESVRPDLIKIDVEGAELAALRGMRDTIRAARSDLVLFVELHPGLWPAVGVTRELVEAELSVLGLRIEPPASGADPWSLEGVALRLQPV